MTHSISKFHVKRYKCGHCIKTFSDTSGTIFARSKVPLKKWIYVLITLLNATGSLSAAEVGRELSISYKTAHGMLKKIRESLWYENLHGQLKGVVESDEAWVSKKLNQQILLGMVERGGAVKISPIIDRSEVSLYYPHKRFVKRGSVVCTDGHMSYVALGIEYIHHSVNHSIGQFAWHDVTTNTIEGVWSMLKGVLRTIHHGVSKVHLMSYCDLFSFIYSNRNNSFTYTFNLLFSRLCQPRYCTY